MVTLLLVEEAVPLPLVLALVVYGKPEFLYVITEFHLMFSDAALTLLTWPAAFVVVTRKLAVHLYPLELVALFRYVMLAVRRFAGGGDGLQGCQVTTQ
jgi:hypothetical protein